MQTNHTFQLCKKPKTEILGSRAATRITTRGDAVLHLVVLSAEFFTTSKLGFLGIAADGRLSVIASFKSVNYTVLRNQFRPNLRQRVLREHFLPRYKPPRRLLNRQPKRDRDWSVARSPAANIGGMCANSFAQGAEPATSA